MYNEKEFSEQQVRNHGVNISIVKNVLRHVKFATPLKLLAETNLSKNELDEILEELLLQEIVSKKESILGNDSFYDMKYFLNTNKSHILALILDMNYISYMVTDLDGQVIEKSITLINKSITYMENLYLIIEEHLRKDPLIHALGMGVPGAVTLQGKVFAIPKIPEFEDSNVKKIIEDKYKIPVSIKNDINVTALGYYRKGIAFTLEEMVYIHMGEGLGAGVIVGGKMLSGFTSFAGEIGYMQVKDYKNTEEVFTKPKKKKDIDVVISRIVNNIVCLINPAIIVLGGALVRNDLPDIIRSNCKKWISDSMVPIIRVIEDEEKYYFDGLIEIALDVYFENKTM